MKIRAALGSFTILLLPILAQALEPLGTPSIDDMILYDDEENSSEEAELGKVLFFDKRLSINHSQSCATCHDPTKGFGDGMTLSTGVRQNTLSRNTPHLYNLGWNTIFMWDGRKATLESQALAPIQSEDEMMLPIDTLVKRLSRVPAYREMFEEAYGEDEITGELIGRALAAFERTLVVDNTPFDRYVAGEKSAISASAQRGLTLFQGQAKCIACHDGPNFTDNSFHSLGIENGDQGRAAIIEDNSLQGAFKTPGLRNVALTAPYMHDGSIADLKGAVEFYNQGGGNADHKSDQIKPLGLTAAEIDDVVAFLNTLTQPLHISMPHIP